MIKNASKKHILIGAVIGFTVILLLLILGIVLFYLANNSNNVPANYKTYSGDGFRLAYPKDYEPTTRNDGVIVFTTGKPDAQASMLFLNDLPNQDTLISKIAEKNCSDIENEVVQAVFGNDIEGDRSSELTTVGEYDACKIEFTNPQNQSSIFVFTGDSNLLKLIVIAAPVTEDENINNQYNNLINSLKYFDMGDYKRTKPELLGESERVGKKSVIKTNKGDIVIELFGDEAPLTVSNHISLAKDGFYDGLTFHRREEGFVIQGGDPNGNGTGGPGYKFEDEPVTREYKRGIVAMANSGPDTNGSQFFIMLDDNPLPPSYTIFGKVVEGMDVVDQIDVGDVMESVVIK